MISGPVSRSAARLVYGWTRVSRSRTARLLSDGMAWLPVCSGIGAKASPRQNRWVARDTRDGFGAFASKSVTSAGGTESQSVRRIGCVLRAQRPDGAAAAAPARLPRQVRARPTGTYGAA